MTSQRTLDAAPPAGWTQRPERSNTALLRAMTWLSLRLGRRASRVVLHAIAAYFFLFSPMARRMSRDYQRRVRGLASPREVDWAAQYRHFLAFATVTHDRVFLVNDRFDLFDIRVHKGELVDALVAQGRGAFLVGAHLGSFEVLRAVGRRNTDLRIAMAMYEENARKINAALGAINPQAQQDIIALGHIDSMIRVNELLDEGVVVGMLADRSLRNDETRPVNFLGEPAQLPLGPFRMAAIMKRPVLFMTGLYLGGNRYAIHFEPLADFSAVARRDRTAAVSAAMARYAALLEQHCRMAPDNWFNFFDFWAPAAAPRALPPTPTP